MRFLVVAIACLFLLQAEAKTAEAVKSPASTVKKAVTDEGQVVILFNDGTWKYEKDSVDTKPTAITENPKKFTKPESSNFQLKSTKNKSAFWINPAEWTFKKSTEGTNQHEYEMLKKNSDLYGMVITEQIEIDMENLGGIALTNARNLAPDMQVVQQEYRNVNGARVLYQKMVGTAKGMRFAFMGYYYSDKSGTTQYVTWTAENLVPKYQADIDNFLNGFALQN